MATSLALQLKQLAVPQTQALLGSDTEKASFLYDSKEAAGIDRETFHYIGLNGLEELSTLDETFEEYETTLFSSTALFFERSVETKEVNEQLDRSIDTFLLKLSPFLRFTCAQNALEWLIHKYRIHLNNVDSLVQSFLPYHLTDLFPRMLKLIDLKAHRNKKWAWLLPVQKNRIQLARQTLVNHCRSDPACLSIITDMVPRFVTVYDSDSKNRDDRLQMVMNFYGITLLALVQSGPVTERLLSAMLPVLCRGLKSSVKDYKAASYVVMSCIMCKTTLKTSLLETVMNGVCKNLGSSLIKEGVSVLLIMFQSQDIDTITKKSFKRLHRLWALPSTLADLSAQFEVSRLAAALFKRLIPAAVKGASVDAISGTSSNYSSEDDAEMAPPPLLRVVHDLLAQVSLDTSTRTLAARLFLESFVQHCGSDDIDREEAVGQVKQLVRLFETRYPDSLDAAVDSVMSSTEDETERSVIKEFLNLTVSSVHHRLVPDSQTTLALSLHHPRSSVRLNAVTFLMDTLDTIDDKNSVKESFLARLQDDNVDVVRVLLKNPQKLWSVFEDKSELTSALLARLKSVDTNVNKVTQVREVMGVLSHGPASPVLETVVLSCLPLCSPHPSLPELAQHVLSSTLAASSSLLSHLKKVWLPKLKGKVGEEDLLALNLALFDSVAEAAVQDSPVQVMEKLFTEMTTLSTHRQKCLSFLLLEVTLRLTQRVTDPDAVSRLKLLFCHMLDSLLQEKKLLSRQLSGFSPPELVVSEVIAQVGKGRRLPAAWWTDLIATWTASCVVPQEMKDVEFWHEVSADSVNGRWLKAIIKMTDLLLNLKTDGAAEAAVRDHITSFQKMFGSADLYLRHLCVLWSGEVSQGLGVTVGLRDKSLQLSKAYLSGLSDSEVTAIVQSSAPVIPCLLGLCASEEDAVRGAALSLVGVLGEKCSGSALYRPALDLVLHYREEITTDTNYLTTALTGLKSKTSRRKSKQADPLSAMLKVVESPGTPCFVVSALLRALSAIDTMDTLTPLLPLLARLLAQDHLSEGEVGVVGQLLTRYTDTVAGDLAHDRLSLQLLVEAIRKPATAAAAGDAASSSSVQLMAIAQISKKFFAALPSLESQRSVAGALLDMLQNTPDTDVGSAIRKVFKHVSLPADLLSQELAPVLQSAASSVRTVKRMRRENTEDQSTFSSPVWIRTTVLLEIMQNKKKIPNSSKLVPFCFQILAKVLEVEDAGEGEYLKQLILGVIYHLCKKHKAESELIEGKDLNFESIVQCIRTSSSPQTHQHALLVLSVAAEIAPEQLLHSMMSMFTFMGASILRQDDSYSFQVITRILETVFPALVMACSEQRQHKVEDMVTMILRVFVDTYPHIPEHRKLMVFTTLLRVVGVDTYLWRLLLVFIEGVATRSQAQTDRGGMVVEPVTSSEGVVEQEGKAKAIDRVHVDFLVTLVLELSPLSCIQMAHQAIQYLAKLPDEKTDSKPKVRRQAIDDASKEEYEIFCLAYHSTRQLHKFRHATILVLHQILASRKFIAMVSDQVDEGLMARFKDLLEALLSYMAHTCRAVDRFATSPQAAYWKGLMAKCGTLLDSLVSLLPQEQFVVVVRELLDSPLVAVQRKALELLALHLKTLREGGVGQQQKAVFLELVPKLQHLLGHLQDGSGGEREEMANMALYTLMLMSRLMGMECHVTFVQVLKHVCQLMNDDSVSSEAAATAMMCAAEIIKNIRAYAIVHLPQVMSAILKQLQAVNSVESEMLPCCVTSLHKVMDTLPHFLTPYIQDILTQVCHVQIMLEEAPSSEHREHVLKSLKHVSKSIAALPPRVFLPTLESCYTVLLDSGRQGSIGSLMDVLGQHLSGLTREDLHLNHQQLLDFFLVVLDFRGTQRKEVSREVMDRVEGVVINTVLLMVLKMTEGTLRPMLLKMFEWATKEGKRDRVMAFYRLADSLAGRLRGLFLLFAAHIFRHATQLLDLLHDGKAEEAYLRKDKKGRKTSMLLGSVLGCLHKVCLFDTQNFINKERFAMLMQPLLDQLENFAGGEDVYRQRVKDTLVPTIADFAAAAKNDSLWQTLNYQLMLKTRSKNKEVRLSALHCLKGLHRKLGEDYVSLMPETIPFLSELMEDECEDVEQLTQEVILDMEETFGEPLQKYFN
ncbi:HEAT repeat-containing protein 1-like isoform X2 [Babylonia areolata]|uniref:HEAT repeat-containing protein 1-like isoform X2 n=1 Tax=Babylonia areolata TaxID=304850 RepID=UPI003FD3B364